jgi:hypothetical protein
MRTDHYEDLRVYGKVILDQILETRIEEYGLN